VNTKKIVFTAAVCAIGIGLNCSIEASAEYSGPTSQLPLVTYSRINYPSKTARAAENQLKKTFRCSQLPDKTFTEIRYIVGEDGRIYEPEITCFSGDDQFDAECLEAVCNLHGLPASGIGRFSLSHIRQRFGKGDPESYIQGSKAPEVAEFLKAHPVSKGDVVVHKIPLSVLSYYPNLFKFEELTSPDNLMILKCRPSQLLDKLYEVDKDGKRQSMPDYILTMSSMYGSWRSCLENQKPFTRLNAQDLGSSMIRYDVRQLEELSDD
jgi:hypothetical protein